MPKLFYSKLPSDINDRVVFLLDPMLATGGSAVSGLNFMSEV